MRDLVAYFWERKITTLFLWKKGLSPILFPLSLIYKLAILVRHCLYDYGIFPSQKLKKATISIGNISVGGTGKTPVIDWIVSQMPLDRKIAVLSRGYRSKTKRSQVFTFEKIKKISWDEMGDESYMLAKKWPSLSFGIGKNRKKNALNLQNQVKLFILDDGLQHRQIKRDLELICLDPNDPIGESGYLPWGRLRDLRHRLSVADAIIVTSRPQDEKKLLQKIKKYSSSPLIILKPTLEGFYNRQGKKIKNPDKTPIWFFSAIAKPERAKIFLQDQGFFIKKTIFKADHAIFPDSYLKKIAKQAEKEGAILCCTEKDAVKYETVKVPLIHYRQKYQIVQGEEAGKKIIEKISSLVRQLR